MFEKISMGVNYKVLRSTLVEEYTATTFAFDLGFLYKQGKYSAGLSANNFGKDIKYDQEGDPLPSNVRLGGVYMLNSFSFNADIIKSTDNGITENLGAEYMLTSYIALRAGYKIGYDLESFTAGLGVHFSKYNLDYATCMMGELDSTHYVSLSMSF